MEVVFCLSLQVRSVLGRCQEVPLYLEEAGWPLCHGDRPEGQPVDAVCMRTC